MPEGLMNVQMARSGSGETFITGMEVDQSAGIFRGMPAPDSEEPQTSQEPQGQQGPQGPKASVRLGGPDATQRLYRVADDGTLSDVNVNWNTGSMGVAMASDIKFLDNGDMIVAQQGTGIVQYGPDGSYKRSYGDIQVEAFTVSGNKIYITDTKSSSVLVYDGETFDHESNVSFDSLTFQTSMATGQNGAVYLYNANGVFRLLPDGSLFERIIDGGMTSLSMPNNFFQSFMETNEGAFLLYASAETESKIFRYVYDPNIAARPENELVVFTLYENNTLRQAAGVFQKAHPDTRINIQVGMGDDGATASEIIRTLNTEIMAGKGPDIIMLDGINADNYIDKGVLLDVSGLISELTAKEQFIESVLKTFESEGKIYAVPVKFSMPTIFVSEEYAADMRDLNSIVDFALNNPGAGIIGDKKADNLFKVFLPASMPGWLAGKEINEEKLAGFLNAVKEMAETEAPVLESPERSAERAGNVMIGRRGPAFNVGESNPDDVFNFAFEKIHTYITKLSSFRALMLPIAASEKRGEYAALPLPGLVENVFIPSAIVGINAKSAQTDIAGEFLKTMLSKDIQSVKLGDGFAVNVSALSATMEIVNGNMMFAIAMMNPNFEGEMLQAGTPSIEAQQEILDLCLGVKTPYIVNDMLAEMVADEAKGYFSGDKDLEKTIADIRERTRIYLAE
jgi:ABC-type glycerol-3-phosphate transport system substrate-binding protein